MKETSLIIITGMSGAGKSVALKTFEDLGFEAIDNIPLSILPEIIDNPKLDSRIAVVIDVRNRDFAIEEFKKLAMNKSVKILFLDAENEILERRYNETRRRHPLADNLLSLSIIHERELIDELKQFSHYLIDTSKYKLKELQNYIKNNFTSSDDFLIHVFSFSYKKGLPREADIVFDVRFLPNPFYVDELKEFDGRDKEVAEFFKASKVFNSFFTNFSSNLAELIPFYKKEGKSYLNIAIGCTGGKHRSVYTATKLAEFIAKDNHVIIKHLELEND